MPDDTALAPRAPAWVRVALWRVDTRASARAFLALSALLGAVGAAAGALLSPIYFGAVASWLAVPWYGAAIRWRDRHGGWHAE